jgi:hypothetical protein
MHTGQLTSRLTNDASQMVQPLNTLMNDLIANLMLLVGGIDEHLAALLSNGACELLGTQAEHSAFNLRREDLKVRPGHEGTTRPLGNLDFH